MKRQIKNQVIGARVTLVLAGACGASLLVQLARAYPAAVAAGAVFWAIGQALVLAESWHLRRLHALRQLEQQELPRK